jgi:hypothetical protein
MFVTRHRSATGKVGTIFLFVSALATGGAAHAQSGDTNLCDVAGEAPDIIVGEILDGRRWGTIDDITSYSFGTDSCNLGTCQADWIAESNRHPLIAQNLFRLKDGRFEQVGQSWLKHGFFAADSTTCSSDCVPAVDGDHLGVNCSDIYGANLNGAQDGLGPKFEVVASTGSFPYPATDLHLTGNRIYKRLQVANQDLDPASNPGARYFVEVQYIARDDALAGNGLNNASYREVQVVVDPLGDFQLEFVGETVREQPAVTVWPLLDPEVQLTIVDVESDGRLFFATRVTDLGDGTWRYQYAIHNLNSHRAARALTIPLDANMTITNIGFHDVDYHSGEPLDGTDWVGVHDTEARTVGWSTSTLAEDPLANALRWGTLYNFRFDADFPPGARELTIGLFRRGLFDDVVVTTLAPQPCDDDGVCEPEENCTNCPNDCPGIDQNGFCGDGICDPMASENCLGCPADCAGEQGGRPADRFCCGGDVGENPVDCSDARCNSAGFACATPCCGDGVCDPGEGSCVCAIDCGAVPPSELICDDGDDGDCDGRTDCEDLDCCTDVACADGVDDDGDLVADCDCDDSNGEVWATPGEALGLLLDQDVATGETTLTWSAPVDPGASSLQYAALRSDAPGDFSTAVCLPLTDPTQPIAVDSALPLSGEVLHYLARAKNGCPLGYGVGSLGVGSGAVERVADPCP